jgi:hypothetical protein
MPMTVPPDLEAQLRHKAQERQVSAEQLLAEAIASYLQREAPSAAGVEPAAGDLDPRVYFARELAAYERHRAVLEREHRGKFVLIRGDELIGVFERSAEASAEGVRRFGLDKFMVHEIGDPVCEMFIGVP